MTPRSLGLALAAVVAGLGATPVSGQLPDYPLSPLRPAGDLVAPFFDGWYANEDGSYTLSFGFLNRNTEENVYIPRGPNNFIEPSELDGMQPEFFPTLARGGFVGRRERGAFAITVPAEFQNRDVNWTITHAGQTWTVPGRVTSPAYELSHTPAAAGSLPPAVRFGDDGPVTTSREGVFDDRKTVRVGEGLELSIWVEDRGVRENAERAAVDVTWQRHQGPGAVEFDSSTQRVDSEGWGQATTLATFREAGDYLVRARVDNFAASDSRFDNQCCWSNGYVPVTVTP